MNSRKIPVWVTTVIWITAIVLTAFFAGQSASLYLRNRFHVQRNVTLARPPEIDTQKRERPLGFYRSSIVPALNQGKKPAGGDTGAPRATAPGGQPGDTPGEIPTPAINWDQILSVEEPALDLKGTVIGDDMAIAFVQVEGKDMSLTIGQQVGSYRVVSITKNTIGFSRGGNDKVVSMVLKSGGSSRGGSTGGIPRPRASSPQANQTIDIGDMISFQGNTRVVDRRKFNALLQPPSQLADELKFIPNSKDDQPYGIRISYLKPGSFFSRIGMRSGDILVRTNNKELMSVEDSFYAYQAFRNEEHLTLEIDRGGNIIQIPLEFR